MMPRFFRTAFAALLASAALGAAGAAAADLEAKRTGGPYVPTPQVVVDEMLRVAGVGPEDFVMDLGSGDGVIVLTAAEKYKARGLGVDIDPELVRHSNLQAQRRRLADRVRFVVQDVFQADVSKASVVTLYLLPSMMTELRGKLYSELRPGARIVSHDYHFGEEWPPDFRQTWDVPEKEQVNGVPKATVYMWIVPARVGGRWRLRLDLGRTSERYEIALRQSYQRFEGAVEGLGRDAKIADGRLRGTEISFTLPTAGGAHRLAGRVAGDTMTGSAHLAGGKGLALWSATRIGD
jgi:phospholipid N-methyltransferase